MKAKGWNAMNKQSIQNISLVALLAGLAALLIAIFSPYASTIFWSVVLYLLCKPLYTMVLKRFNPNKKTYSVKQSIAAAIFSVGTVLIIAAVLITFAFLIIRQFIELSESIITLLQTSRTENSFADFFHDIAERIYRLSHSVIDIRAIDIKAVITGYLAKYSNTIFSLGKNFFQSAGRFVLSIAFVCFSLYFFYVDGDYLSNLLSSAVPIESSSMKKLLAKFSETLMQLIRGLVLVALYQAAAAFVVFSIFGVKGSLLLAVVTFFAAFIPLIGSGIIWAPIAIVLFLTGSKLKAFAFFIIAGTVISLMDNVLRPLILKDTIKIHPLLIFFSLLGGVKLLGFKGIILGPMTIIIFFAVLDLVLNNGDAASEVPAESSDNETKASE